MAESEKTKSEWVITPGLSLRVDRFIELYDHLKGKPGRKWPVMIMGDRGVGKSLFESIYEKLYRRDHKEKKVEVKPLNVSAIPEKLIESELFGYVDGAFTDARKGGKEGLVKSVDLLILEEIGDLPDTIQAKLLTFLEDKQYYPVGATKPEKAEADLQIIATTNKKQEDMRSDFYDRFVKFSVPPLYKRRLDVLYYISHFSPDLCPYFYSWEIMALLAHSWPGNVREIETACLAMEMHRRRMNEEDTMLQRAPFLMFIQNEHSGLQWDTCRERYWSLEREKVNVELLESVLNQYGLALTGIKKKKPLGKSKYPSSELTNKEKERDEFLGTQTLATRSEYEKLERGLNLFQILFLKSAYDENNLLAVRTGKPTLPFYTLSNFIKEPRPEHDRLVLDIWEYVNKIKLPADKKNSILNMKPSQNKDWYLCLNMEPNEPDADGPRCKAKEPKENPFELKETDLLRDYYSYHRDKGLKVSEAARATGNFKKGDSTFRGKLKRVGLTPWR